MRRTSLSLTLVVTSLALLLQAAPAHAQASRTWVSGLGDDVNPCSRTAPCKTFAGAISKTAVNGEINCLDPGGFGAVTITKSITIDCHEVFASILNAGTNAINIPFDSFAATDARKTVRLRNLNLNGFATGLNGIRITGGAVTTGGAVFIEDCVIDGNFGSTGARGISDERIGGGALFVSNTTVRNVAQVGIAISPSSGTNRLSAVLDNVRVENSAGSGVAISSSIIMINRSVFSGNAQAGIFAASASDIHLSNSVTSHNGIGIQNGGGAVIRLSSTDIAFNGTALSGATQSFSNNRLVANAALGTAPTPIGLTSNPTGLQ